MTTNTNTTLQNNTNVVEETSKFSLAVMLTSAVMVGIWGVACLVGGLNSTGFTGLIKGFLTATGM